MHDAPPRDVLPFKATVNRGGPAPPSTVGLPFLPPEPKTMHGAIAITAGPELGAGALPRTEGIPEKPATLLDAMNGAVLERDAASTTRQSAPAQRIRERSRSPTMLRLLWFDPALPRTGHYGLRGIHEQATLIGAKLGVLSEPGKGTRIVLVFET